MINIVFLSYKLHISFLHLLTSILSGKNGKSLCRVCNSFGYSTSASMKYPETSTSLSSSKFFIKSSFIVDRSSTYSKPSTGNFLDIAYPYKLFASIYIMYDDSLFLS